MNEFLPHNFGMIWPFLFCFFLFLYIFMGPFSQSMNLQRLGTSCRSRQLLLATAARSRCVSIDVCVLPPHFPPLLRLFHLSSAHYAAEKPTKTTTKTALTDKPGESYLEQMLAEQRDQPKTTGQKVTRAAENTLYYVVGLGSVAVLVFITYYIVRELWAFDTPQGLYRKAVKRVKEDERCQELFGRSMLTFGEESGRGRRRHIANQRYTVDGKERLRIMFHVKGQNRIGRVHAEIVRNEENGGGGWEYRYIMVETDGHPKERILIIDNRREEKKREQRS